MSILSRSCPICREKFIVKHNRILLAEVFVRIDFEMMVFNHLQTHVEMPKEVHNRIGGKCEA